MKSRNIPLYVGVRSELDLKFREIIEGLPEGTNLNEFIKQAVVSANSHEAGAAEIENVKAELMKEIRKLQYQFQSAPVVVETSAREQDVDDPDDAVQRLADSLTDAF